MKDVNFSFLFYVKMQMLVLFYLINLSLNLFRQLKKFLNLFWRKLQVKLLRFQQDFHLKVNLLLTLNRDRNWLRSLESLMFIRILIMGGILSLFLKQFVGSVLWLIELIDFVLKALDHDKLNIKPEIYLDHHNSKRFS